MLETTRLMTAVAVYAAALGFGGSAEAAAVRIAPMQQAAAPMLRSGSVVLGFFRSTNGYGVRVHDLSNAEADAVASAPASISVCSAAAPGAAQCGALQSDTEPQPTLARGYDTVSYETPSVVVAVAHVMSPGRSQFVVTDTYQGGPTPDTFAVSRTVAVASAGADAGFNSEYSVGFDPSRHASTQRLADYHFFAPGIWYDKNAYAAPYGLAGNFANRTSFFWRETRSGLPLVMIQDPYTGTAFTLSHVAPAPSPAPDENVTSPLWLIDFAQYGSLGVSKLDAALGLKSPVRPTVGFYFPAQEGDVNYVTSGSGWVRRSSPLVQPNGTLYSQRYELLLSLRRYVAPGATGFDRASFAAAMQGTWREFYGVFAPQPVPVSAQAVVNAGIGVLNANFLALAEPNDTTSYGFPFAILDPFSVFDQNSRIGFKMGFTGQELPLAYQLFRQGLLSKNSTDTTRGQQILNFWASQDPASEVTAGFPLTDYVAHNTFPGFMPSFVTACNEPIFMRTLSDGMEGMLSSAMLARRDGRPQPAWESFSNGFGAWLRRHQNADGSFYRSFTAAGKPFVAAGPACQPTGYAADGYSKLNTTFPIRYLVMMYFATGDPHYELAAERAGNWALANIYAPMSFVGGVENVDYLDRESGIDATNAALAMYDLYVETGRPYGAYVWYQAAQRAADYIETWMYAYDFPLRDQSQVAPSAPGYPSEPAGRFRDYVQAGTRATSLVVTGASTGDIDLSIAAFDFFRLYVISGGTDAHDLAVARLLESNTKLTTQLPAAATPQTNQEFGYANDGILTEAITLANMGFPSQQIGPGYVAWLTNSELDPASRLQDAFGSVQISSVLSSTSLSKAEAENRMIYPKPGAFGWNAARPSAAARHPSKRS